MTFPQSVLSHRGFSILVHEHAAVGNFCNTKTQKHGSWGEKIGFNRRTLCALLKGDTDVTDVCKVRNSRRTG